MSHGYCCCAVCGGFLRPCIRRRPWLCHPMPACLPRILDLPLPLPLRECCRPISAGALNEMRSRLIAGLKRYFHSKRMEGLLSVQVSACGGQM